MWIGTDPRGQIGTDPTYIGAGPPPLDGGVDATSEHAVDDHNLEYRATANDTTHGNQIWETAGQMDLPKSGESRYREPTRQRSLGRTLGADIDYRRSVEPVDLKYLEDMIRRLVRENRFRSNDECGTSPSWNLFTENILHLKHPQRFVMPTIPPYGGKTYPRQYLIKYE